MRSSSSSEAAGTCGLRSPSSTRDTGRRDDPSERGQETLMKKLTIRYLALASACTAILAVAGGASAQTTLTIESWRNDDLQIWNEQIIPAFNKAHPDIKVVFQPTAPTEYNAALNSKLSAGTAGDLVACRPFDASLQLYKDGHL